jgi:hypothetical protein
VITLTLDARSGRFGDGAGSFGDALPLGPAQLVQDWLRHDPPTGAELEAAIEVVEDLVMPLHGRWPADEELRVVSAQAAVATLAGLASDAVTRDQLEDLFNRAAAVAQGRPRSSDPLLAQPQVMATVLVLREAMHHLGFTRLVLARP